MVVFDNPGRKIFRGVLVTVAAFGVTALYRLVLHVNQTTVALTFIVLVLVVASRWQLVYSIYLSLLCALLYNFFFLPPFGTFTIADPQNWIALIAFLGASLIVSRLAEREHTQGVLSEQRREEVERLYEFSQQMLLQDDLSELARNVPRLIASVFHLRSAALFVQGQKTAFYSDPTDEVVSMTELQLAASSPEAGKSAMPGIRLVPLMLGLRSVGALAMREENYSDGMYVAIGGLVATTRVSTNAIGDQGDYISQTPFDLGRRALRRIQQRATNLVPGDTNNVFDVFVKDRLPATIKRASELGRRLAQGNSSFRRATRSPATAATSAFVSRPATSSRATATADRST